MFSVVTIFELLSNKIESFFTSSRGGRKLAFEGFRYNTDTQDSKSGKTYWKCDIQQCKGRIITDYDDRILREWPHSHGPDTPQIQVQRCMARLKEAAIN